MKARRSLNLLVAAAGLVFLSGCATETLTDSAFWSYLPFTSDKGGKGSGGPGGSDARTPKVDNVPTTKSTDGAKPKTTQRSTDPASEEWNDPVKPKLAAEPSKQSNTPPREPNDPAGRSPAVGTDVGGLSPKDSAASLPVRIDLPTAPVSVQGSGPTLPSLDSSDPAAKNSGPVTLPHTELNPTAPTAPRALGLGDPTAQAPASRTPASNPETLDLPGPKAKPQRTPLRLPELLVDGIGPTTVGKPTIAELPKRSTPPQPGDSLNLPREVLGEPAAATPGQASQRLPRAITDDPQRPVPPTASLSLPGIPADATTSAAGQAPKTGTLPGQANPAKTNPSGPAVAIPGAPDTKASAGRTLTGGGAGSPATAKPNGESAPLPNVGQLPPLPTPPIPAPFRLSEWISNDALHQSWRRQQSTRAELEPQIRGSEQQRLRLILDTYLLREKPAEKTEK
jgi:hypothetical protein